MINKDSDIEINIICFIFSESNIPVSCLTVYLIIIGLYL